MNKQIVKKYTLIKIFEQRVDNILKPVFEYDEIGGYYNSLEYPQTIFDSEEDALKYMETNELWGNWTIIPVYSFEYVD